MILGIGNDIVDIERIKGLIDQFGDKFLNRVFTAHEIEYAKQHKKPEATFAKRFCAKEAALKALGTGFANGISWTDIEVTNLSSGQPCVEFYGNAKDILAQKANELVQGNERIRTFVSLSDTETLASATVVIEILENKS